MPIIQNTAQKQDLGQYDVYIEDTSVNSDYFAITRLPQYFTGGRNSFLIGGSEYLQNGSEILIEILDEEGNPVFETLVPNYIEGNSRMISVEVYDTISPGIGTLVIMGKAVRTLGGQQIPDEWKDTYNVRWSKKILIDYNLKNLSPIKFLSAPEITVVENRFYNINSSSYDTNTVKFTASLSPLLIDGVQQGYSIQSVGSFKFLPEYTNGFITGSFRIGTGSVSQLYLPLTKILNSTTATTSGYLISSSLTNGFIKSLYLRSGSYTASLYGSTYNITSSAELKYSIISTSSVNIPISYAKLTIPNLNTVSGELYKIRVYNKVANETSDYKLIGDSYVDTNEILVSSSIKGNLPLGNIFVTQNYSDNWIAGGLQVNTGQRNRIYTSSGSARYYDSTTTADQFAISSSNDILLSSMYVGVPINTSTNKFANQVSESGYFIGTKRAIQLFPTTEYTLTTDAYYRATSASITLTGNTPRVDIYLIGTGSTKVVDVNPLGQKIGELTTAGTTGWFEQEQFNFSPAIKSSGDILLRFVVSNGFWNFSNISIKPASDPQFSPDEVTLVIPNTEYHNELLQYKVEFFDINNNSANTAAISTPVFFTGSAIDLGTLS